MTSLDEGFFLALREDPSDHTTRLVYADWLDDYGSDSSSARAELIRVQVEIATALPQCRASSARIEELTLRQNELLAAWEFAWLGEWTDKLDGWAFRSGFVEAVQADASVFLEQASEWFDEWPTLSVVKLTRARDHLEELAECPWLAHLRGLDLSDNDIDSERLAPLLESRFICLLQALDLSGNPIGPRGAGRLANATFADELSELHLKKCGFGSHGLRPLLDGSRSRQWRRLDLSYNGLKRNDMAALVGSPTMSNLTSLDLSLNPLESDGTVVLAESPNCSALVELGLCRTETGNAGATAIAHSRYLSRLRSLDLRENRCFSAWDDNRVLQGGIVELARTPLLGQLRRLLLLGGRECNGWTADVMRLARPPKRPVIAPGGWISDALRDSRYLVPSILVECDVEEIWWLGDRANRERLPNEWANEGL